MKKPRAEMRKKRRKLQADYNRLIEENNRLNRALSRKNNSHKKLDGEIVECVCTKEIPPYFGHPSDVSEDLMMNIKNEVARDMMLNLMDEKIIEFKKVPGVFGHTYLTGKIKVVRH